MLDHVVWVCSHVKSNRKQIRRQSRGVRFNRHQLLLPGRSSVFDGDGNGFINVEEMPKEEKNRSKHHQSCSGQRKQFGRRFRQVERNSIETWCKQCRVPSGGEKDLKKQSIKNVPLLTGMPKQWMTSLWLNNLLLHNVNDSKHSRPCNWQHHRW